MQMQNLIAIVSQNVDLIFFHLLTNSLFIATKEVLDRIAKLNKLQVKVQELNCIRAVCCPGHSTWSTWVHN